MPSGVYKRTEEQIKKLQDRVKLARSFITEEVKLKMSKDRFGKPRGGNPENWKHTEKTKNYLRKINLGKTISLETRKKQSDSLRGVKKSQEHRKNISKGKKDKKASQEAKMNMSIFHKNNSSNALGKHWKLSEEDNKRKSNLQKGKMPIQFLGYSNLGIKRFNETKQKLREIRLKQKIPFRDTSIERKIESELKTRKISFKKQIPLCKVAIVDFFLEELGIIIQADGCFWHGCPEHNPEWTKNKIRDNNQDKILQENGYKVFRFWEHDINRSVQDCVDKLLIN